jgi:hypothetical protein
MGNALLDEYKKNNPVDIYERWLEQNPDLLGKELLSDNKLFRASSFKYNNKNIKIRVYFKRDTLSIS